MGRSVNIIYVIQNILYDVVQFMGRSVNIIYDVQNILYDGGGGGGW